MPLHRTMLRDSKVDSQRTWERTVHVECGGANWCVRADHQEALLGPGSPDWFGLGNDPRAEPIKPGRLRMTWRVTLGTRTVFAKVVDNGRWLDRLKRWTIGDAVEREWRAGRKAEARGVPVVRPIAVGGHKLRSVFLSEGLPRASRLSDYWERQVWGASPPVRRTAATDLIDAAAHLFAVAHECGFVHGDAHPNNILVSAASTGAIKLRFVDVASATFSRGPASMRRSLRSLAQLDQYFRLRATRTERLRFLRQYLSERATGLVKPGLPGRKAALRRQRGPGKAGLARSDAFENWAKLTERQLLGRLSKMTASHRARLVRQRDRRLRRNGKYFATLALEGGWKATVVLKLERRHLFPEPDVPDRTESDWGKVLDALLTTVAQTRGVRDAFDYNGFHVAVDRPGRLRTMLKGSPHRCLFERCHKRRHRAVPTELILAYARRRRAGLIDTTLVVRPKRTAKSR